MQTFKRVASVNKQHGAVLILALIIMMLTGLVAGTVLRTSVVEVKMVSNTQFKEEAFQKSESIINAVSASRNNFIVAGNVGYRNCATGDTDTACNATQITLPTDVVAAPTGVDLNYHVDRKGPLVSSLPFREDDSNASGTNSYDVALFEVVSEFDGRDERLGHYEIWQGVALKVAASHQ